MRSSSFFISRKFATVLIAFYFVISVFEPYINGTLGSLTKFYVLGLALYLLIGRKATDIKLCPLSLCYALWLMYKISSLLWTQDFTTPALHFVSQVGMVFLVIVLLSGNVSRNMVDVAINTYWLVSVSLAVLSLFFSQSYLSDFEARQVLVLFGVEADPNDQSALLLVGAAVSLHYLLFAKRYRIFSLASLCICAFACAKTSSRAALVTLVMLIAVTFILTLLKGDMGNKLKNAFIFVALLVLLAYALINFLDSASFDRLFVQGFGTGSGRTSMWNNALNYYLENPIRFLFGAGWGTATVVSGTDLAIHNTFLTLLLDVGFFGTVLFMIPLFLSVSYCYKNNDFLPLILIIAAFIPAFFIDAINKRFFWNAVILCLLRMNSERFQENLVTTGDKKNRKR